MLERTLVLVDTSYLLASFYNSWEEGARGQLEISLATVVHRLDQVAHGLVDQPASLNPWKGTQRGAQVPAEHGHCR